jgi:hypothetical protein
MYVVLLHESLLHVFALTNIGALQLRVTAARPGVVNFELDIKKEHTVSFLFYFIIHYSYYICSIHLLYWTIYLSD